MAEFVKGNQLNAELEKIFERAEEQLVIISPFIKLHSRFVDVLKSKKNDYKLKITVVFGKNEDNISKSFSQEDFDFLKDFPNIEIKYEPRLHAKYYANESAALLSSMNLYDFSQNNNIEFGILTKATLVGALTGNLLGDTIDKEAFNYFDQVINNSKTLFQRTPLYEKANLGLSKKYTHSDEIDELSGQLGIKTLTPKSSKPKQTTQDTDTGYCIRTGDKIPFNPDRPLSDKAYKSWNKYKDKDYKEKYCHFSGEPSNGETSFSKPIMKKNWNKAKEK
ncbi:MAG: phospholipase D family protein [Vicingus serpentipes]|nr:phospholipase D family protein [Vicingus serpentipes]